MAAGQDSNFPKISEPAQRALENAGYTRLLAAWATVVGQTEKDMHGE